ncbi:MAG: shikimate kinase [Clostridia bacterium]|nr:shikimate kinase [Clostridia bacterium]
MKSYIIIGMPGSGKTTIGRAAAEMTGYDFIDLDSEITRQHGDITSIFKDEGEEVFRLYETQALKSALDHPKTLVSTGGGIIEKDINRKLLKRHKVLFIDRTLENIYSTLDSDSRPLLKGKREALGELYERRYPMYIEAADYVVKNDGSFSECVKKIIKIISQE